MRICFFGDSIVNGTGDDDALGWVGRIVAQARNDGRDITYYNLGIRRDTSGDIAGRWRAEMQRRLAPQFPQRLAFSFGANDCADNGDGQPRLALDTAIANAEAILTAARTLAPTLMIGPAPILSNAAADARVRLLSAGQAALCARIGVPFLAIADFVAQCEPWRREAAAGDGTHPNRGGYAALAQFIGEWPDFRSWIGG